MHGIEFPEWFPIDLAKCSTEAVHRWEDWRTHALANADAQVKIEGWVSPDGIEEYVISTDHLPLTRLKPEGTASAHKTLSAWDASSLRSDQWRLEKWHDLPALISTDGNSLRRYKRGDTFDSEGWRVVNDGWDHEHCQLCGDHICLEPGCGHSEAYATGEGDELYWVCPPCY